jgi:hypothetical protein
MSYLRDLSLGTTATVEAAIIAAVVAIGGRPATVAGARRAAR